MTSSKTEGNAVKIFVQHIAFMRLVDFGHNPHLVQLAIAIVTCRKTENGKNRTKTDLVQNGPYKNMPIIAI